MKKIYLIIVILFGLIANSYAAQVYLEPSSGTMLYWCPFDIDIIVDTQDIESNSIGVKLFNSPNHKIVGFEHKDSIFGSYVWPKDGFARHKFFLGMKTTYIMWTSGSPVWFKGKGKFGTIQVEALSGDKLELKFYMIPNYDGDDSNIPYMKDNKIIDALSEAIWGTYQLMDWICDNINKEKSSTESDIDKTLNWLDQYKLKTPELKLNPSSPTLNVEAILNAMLINKGEVKTLKQKKNEINELKEEYKNKPKIVEWLDEIWVEILSWF